MSGLIRVYIAGNLCGVDFNAILWFWIVGDFEVSDFY